MPWAAIIPAAIGAVSSIAGGIMSSNAASAANASQEAIAERNIQLQREFAQQGIRWKVEDAQAAGVHPIFGLGAQTQSFTPVQVGHTTPDTSWISSAGQNVGRAVQAAMTQDERRMTALKETLQINRMGLENEFLKAQINNQNLRTAMLGPPMPSLGQTSPGGGNSGDVASGNVGVYKLEPSEVSTSLPSNAGQSAGPAIPTATWGMSSDARGIQAFPPKNLGVEDELGAPLMLDWYIRNRLVPNISNSGAPEMSVIRRMFPGATGVRFDRTEQRWVPTYPSVSDDEIRRSIHGPTALYPWRRAPQRGAYIGRYD